MDEARARPLRTFCLFRLLSFLVWLKLTSEPLRLGDLFWRHSPLKNTEELVGNRKTLRGGEAFPIVCLDVIFGPAVAI